ncbi:MAG: hypothetical protein LKI58_00090 [Actinomyces sp.]|jgi:hypothetical protein|nr:hypothetical protein [Actinomyces sp.]MCI1641527.1 hypothetical protein [Actinomyces sp.]MCI1661729.1 hypothetical protein [Actinomyces sp.]MCI1690477.1 hypothetical protein [Actinomyces sp.]MCI1786458.1 hypothetical protein [Actinomyces sp.]MCI1866139.1 hypothetical protein [Actinomyces sp.]
MNTPRIDEQAIDRVDGARMIGIGHGRDDYSRAAATAITTARGRSGRGHAAGGLAGDGRILVAAGPPAHSAGAGRVGADRHPGLGGADRASPRLAYLPRELPDAPSAARRSWALRPSTSQDGLPWPGRALESDGRVRRIHGDVLVPAIREGKHRYEHVVR